MSSLADSDAVLDLERLLPQHQAALTLLQGMLSDPECQRLAWLDLACGKGQIIAHLRQNLSETDRAKVNLVGYDIENKYSKQAKKIAESMGLGAYDFQIGALQRFWENRATTGPWNFITLTNTTHEISPASLAEILVKCVERLGGDGCLFVYDMERLPNPELGAVTWSAGEVKAILTTLLQALGATKFEPSVGSWAHKSCTGWNAQIRRAHLKLPIGYEAAISAAIKTTNNKIQELLETRLTGIDSALDSLAEHGAETGEEASDKDILLYEFWAVTRALGDFE